MAMSELKKWETLKRYLEIVATMPPRAENVPDLEVIRFVDENIASLEFRAVEENHDEAEAKPKPTEPDELQRLRDQMGHLGKALAGAVGKDVREIRSTLEGIDDRLKRLEAWSSRLVDWGNAHRHRLPSISQLGLGKTRPPEDAIPRP